jgi:protocatechuate 3,4-dioxygenase beta subunit
MEANTNPRVVEIYWAAVDALRKLVVDLGITQDELHFAADFFDTMGQERNFHTLLDATLSTACIEAQLRRGEVPPLESVEGPRYLAGAPERPDGNLVEHLPDDEAEALVVHGRVVDLDTGEPIEGAVVDVWQADHHGDYDRTGTNLRGIVHTDADGRFTLRTILPADYPTHFNDTIEQLYVAALGRHVYRAAHLHIRVHVDGRLVLTTQFFRSDSTLLDTDLVVGIVRPELITEVLPPEAGSDEWRMDVVIPVPRRPLQASEPGATPQMVPGGRG